MKATGRGFIVAVLLTLVTGFGVAHGQSQSSCVTGGAVPAGNSGLAQDCETLLSMQSEISGTANLNWSSARRIDTWDGVRTGGSPARVTIIKLQKRELTGTIPAAIGRLDKLQDIWLYTNNLSGPIPSEVGGLADLKTLMLAKSGLSGQIPLSLNNLKLQRLWLSGNSFTGCVPHKLAEVSDNDLSRVDLPLCASDGTTPPPTPPVTGPAPPEGETLSQMIQRVRPAVVNIRVEFLADTTLSAGSGFIVRTDDEGAAFVLTNDHVIDEITDPLVLVGDKDTYTAEVVSRDPRRDIAMLRICCGEFTTVDFEDSDTLYAGDEVILIGYGASNIMPRTFRPGRPIVPGEATVNRGIISAFRYSTWRDSQFVQHDAAQNGGDSGSPLFSRAGRVIGLNTWTFRDSFEHEISREGLHFAVLETTVQERLSIWGLGPADRFGPLAGRLVHDAEDNYIEQFRPDFTADEDEFTLSATFVNPYSADEGEWDYGFRFGYTGEASETTVAVVVTSDEEWWVTVRDSNSESHTQGYGLVPQLRTGDGERNELTLFVDGPYGWLFVNGEKMRDAEGVEVHYGRRLDLGGQYVGEHGGTVAITTGNFVGRERTGYSTRYEGFTGWTYSHGD